MGVLDNGEIPVVDAITADAGEAAGHVAQVGGELAGGVAFEAGVGIEPAADGALAAGERDGLEVSIEDGIAEAEGVLP